MSNVERNDVPIDPAGAGSEGQLPGTDPALPGDVSATDAHEDALARNLDRAASDVTSRLSDLQDELGSAPRGGQAGTRTAEEGTPGVGGEPQGGLESAGAPFTPVSPVIPPGQGTSGRSAGRGEGTDDDRVLAALAWLSMVVLQLPIVGVLQLLSATHRDRHFQRHHAVTSLLFFIAAIVYEIVAAIAFTVLTIATGGCLAICLWVVFVVPHAAALYYAYQAYLGRRIELPGLSDFARGQGWL